MEEKTFPAIGYELKAKYQRNMLLSMGVVTINALLLALGIKFGGATQPHDEAAVSNPQSDLTVEVVEPDMGESRPARQSHGLNPYEGTHKGFAGFTGYKIIPDVPTLAKVVLPQVITNKPDPIIVDTTFSYANIEDDTEVVELGSPVADYLPNDIDGLPKRVVNREVELITNTLPDVPWIAKENDRGGYVEVLMYIDSTGKTRPYSAVAQSLNDSTGFFLDFVTKDGRSARLRFFVSPVADSNTCQYLVVKEEPRDYGFAKNLTDVLPKWVFSPKVEGNRPVGTFVRVAFNFCDSKTEMDCQRFALIRS